MGTDEAALIQLWREKPGEVQPADLSDVLMVQLGAVTEDLNRRWYERNTGSAVAIDQASGQIRLTTLLAHASANGSHRIGRSALSAKLRRRTGWGRL